MNKRILLYLKSIGGLAGAGFIIYVIVMAIQTPEAPINVIYIIFIIISCLMLGINLLLNEKRDMKADSIPAVLGELLLLALGFDWVVESNWGTFWIATLGGFSFMALGFGLISWAIWGNTTYYTRAGMPGGGVEGFRDAGVAKVPDQAKTTSGALTRRKNRDKDNAWLSRWIQGVSTSIPLK